jgi:D-glycero-alpha-D-manno-heptose-7-phosphate kinase
MKALFALRGQRISTHEIALKAIELEQTRLKENVGSQDQVAVAHGGLNRIHFRTNGGIEVEPLEISSERKAELESRLLLFYSGMSRSSSDVATSVVANFSSNEKNLRRMRTLVDEAVNILRGPTPIDDFGRLLHETWTLKKCQSKLVSNSEIDSIYQKATGAGALGGKLLGAGSSGFMVFFAPPDRQADIKAALHGLLHVPFKFETEGTVLLHESGS